DAGRSAAHGIGSDPPDCATAITIQTSTVMLDSSRNLYVLSGGMR
ncbi:MAG: hypothetical protein JWP63_672, partial [Candidatus Solibacter sp.]|nr:hypothetical protein [Candidatus Solibacter sp.]